MTVGRGCRKPHKNVLLDCGWPPMFVAGKLGREIMIRSAGRESLGLDFMFA
jgi:hypothetical protein